MSLHQAASTSHLDPGAPEKSSELRIGNPTVPPELPLLLDKVYPINEIVRVDYFLPGCPPSGDAIWKVLTDLLAGKEPELGHGLMHYD